MIDAKEMVLWVNNGEGKVLIETIGEPGWRRAWKRTHGIGWCDPIGAVYSQWREMTDKQRVQLMLETAIDLTMQGLDLGMILREFGKVRQFRNLGSQSYPMCRALTKALVGRCLEPNTMTFEELLVHYPAKSAGET